MTLRFGGQVRLQVSFLKSYGALNLEIVWRHGGQNTEGRSRRSGGRFSPSSSLLFHVLFVSSSLSNPCSLASLLPFLSRVPLVYVKSIGFQAWKAINLIVGVRRIQIQTPKDKSNLTSTPELLWTQKCPMVVFCPHNTQSFLLETRYGYFVGI